MIARWLRALVVCLLSLAASLSCTPLASASAATTREASPTCRYDGSSLSRVSATHSFVETIATGVSDNPLRGPTSPSPTGLAALPLPTSGSRFATNSVSETTGGLTNLGRGATGVTVDDFAVGQGFSGVYDEATGSVLALPSSRASALPENWVSARGGHAVVDTRLTQAIGAPGGSRAGFTAFLEADGSLGVEWLSRSVNGLANPYVPEAMRPGILEAPAKATGRAVVSR